MTVEFDYTDAAGNLVFQVCRSPRKEFRQRRPDRNGGWIWNLQGVRPVLYRLPEVVAAVAAGTPVYVVEGERDVETLRRLGLVATCNPMGAGRWAKVDSTPLHGAAAVLVIADNDDPGRDHAWQVADNLKGHVGEIRVLHSPHAKDVSDHVAHGHHLDELVPLEADATASEVDSGEPFEDREYNDRARPASEALNDVPTYQFQRGDEFALDVPAGVPAVWGSGDEVLWPEGEPILIVAPPGVGKTTLTGQLVEGRIGVSTELLGYPIAPGRRVLYLACDRPHQIARSLHRIFAEEDRAKIGDRLVVWRGPVPADFAKYPETLLTMCRAAEADTVFIDSLKDVAIGLTDDEVAAGLNRAFQMVCAEGIQLCATHHQRKGQNGAKPRTLEDVYGSTWIAAGAGSVVLLWGQAGDSIIDLAHLKQPAGEVGPLKVEHDHAAGRTSLHRGFDLLTMLRNAPHGLTVPEVSRVMFEKSTPTENEERKARRRIDRLVLGGLVVKTEATQGGAGGTQPARYTAADTAPDEGA